MSTDTEDTWASEGGATLACYDDHIAQAPPVDSATVTNRALAVKHRISRSVAHALELGLAWSDESPR